MTQKISCSCGGSGTAAAKKKVLVYACSGAANVAEIADHVARQLTGEGLGQMFCLAGLGAGIPNMVQSAKDADLNLVIDGCPMDCAKLIFQKLGLTNVKIIRVTDHGIEKAKGVKITDEQVQKIVTEAKQALAAA
ncbi:MAG: putative zinc-binding protein [Phycisphaerae bacterium]